MLRLLRVNVLRFGSAPPRRQNFFELNPIFPDIGQKDFDIYNVDYKHITSGKLAVADEVRNQKLKEKLTKDIYLQPILERTYGEKNGQLQIDEETGFPVGIHENFDTFIQIFKRQKKVGSNITGEFEELVMKLMHKFQVKSQLELIKIFRHSLASIKKNSLKQKLRGLLMNTAFLQFLKKRKFNGQTNYDLKMEHLQPFLDKITTQAPQPIQNSQTANKTQNINMPEKQLDEISFRIALKQLDQKILNIEEELQKQAISNGTFIPTYHPKYGKTIVEEQNYNLDSDLNFPRGFNTSIETTQLQYSPFQSQDRYIESRINRLFFLRALNQIQAKQQLTNKQIEQIQSLPIHIRQKDKIINSLIYRYKEYDLLIEPDLSDIYNQIDIALKKMVVKVVPNYISNQHQNANVTSSTSSQVSERIISKDVLLWEQLDVEEIFDPEYYEQQQVDRIKLKQNQLSELSPSAVLELSLNKLPLNLYRHQDLDNFGVFNKYRKRIYKDYITDRTIDPEIEFKFFSLEEAKDNLKKITRNQDISDKYYGHATRKSSEAEVYVTKGNGKVLINGQPLADYYGDVYYRGQTLKPLIFTQTAGQFDLQFTVVGGGLHSQSECMAMALTKALIMVNKKYEKILSRFGLTGCDDRRNEAKKLGFYTARVRPPYVRR